MWEAEPLLVLTLVILVMVIAGRSLINNQGDLIERLLEANLSLTKNVGKLEVLFREDILRRERKDIKTDERLTNIETIVQIIKDKQND